MIDLKNERLREEDLPDAISDKNKEKLLSIAGSDRTAKSKRPNKVTSQLCDLLKDMKGGGMTGKEIMSVTPINSPDTLYLHLNGDCEHKSGSISYTECGWIRFHARRGSTTKQLSKEYDVDNFAIRQHATGKCWHEHGCDPVSGEKLRENANKKFTITSVCDECKEEFEHKRYRDRRFCSESCNGKHAGKQAHN